MHAASHFRPRLISLEGRDVPSTTNLFDANFYLARNPDVAAAVQAGRITPENHFRLAGDAEGRSGSPVFTAQAYLDDNPDVRAAVVDGRITAFRHFELAGQFERRSSGRSFVVDDYLRTYPDVAAAVQAGQMSAAEHFLYYGQHEDRLPFNGFTRTDYLADNPDVREAVEAGTLNAVKHYTNFGQFENRRFAAATRITLEPGQELTLTGTSADHDDRKFYSFILAQPGSLKVDVETGNGVFAQVELEDARSGFEVLETDPNGGINNVTGEVAANVPYLLRIRSPESGAAQFTVRLTV